MQRLCVGTGRPHALLLHQAARLPRTAAPPQQLLLFGHGGQPTIARKQGPRCRVVADAEQQAQPKLSDSMATIQALMARVQEQLQAQSKLRFDNPALAQELKSKAEQHLELLMRLAESQQEMQVQGGGADRSSSAAAKQVQDVLRDLQTQLDLEQQAMLTASRAASNDSSSAAQQQQQKQQQQQGDQAQADGDSLQAKLVAAQAEASRLQRRLEDVEYMMHSAAEELAEHRELQMAYDRQCQDLYRLRMQLQLVQSQGTDAASMAAQANKQHKQDLAWLMDAHRKEISDAHRKNQEITQEVQHLRLKVLEQEQLLWSVGALTDGSQQQLQQQPAVAAAAQTGSQSPQQEVVCDDDPQPQQTSSAAAQQQEQNEAEVQLQQLQASAEELAAEKQQLMRNLQDSQREQAVLLVELQNLRNAAAAAEAAAAAAAATSNRDAEAAALSQAAAAAEAALKVQLQEAQQQRDGLVEQVQNLQANLQEAQAAAAAAAAASRESLAAAASTAASGQQGELQVDAAAAVQELKAAKVEMAGLRVQLADARRELRAASGRAEAAEAALQQQAAGFEARLAKLQSWYSKQAAVVAQLRKGKAPRDGLVGFTNTNRFWVPQALLFDFLKHWATREAQLQQQEGFLGLQVQPGASTTPDGGVDVTVSSLWETIPAWEEWSKSAAGTQQHLPTGIFQYVPAKGEGFPEAFVPFRDYDAPVNAKY